MNNKDFKNRKNFKKPERQKKFIKKDKSKDFWADFPTDARAAAFRIIVAVVVEKKSLNFILDKAKSLVNAEDRALFQNLVYGVLREFFALSKIRDEMLNKKLESPELGIILNLGIFQLLRLNLAEYAVLNETVELCKKNKLFFAVAVVNAILRNVLRKKAELLEKLESYKIYNLPLWLFKAYKDKDLLLKIATANLEIPPFTLRCRDRDLFLTNNPTAQINPLHPQAVIIENGTKIEELAEFKSGVISVQDASAQWAATILNPQNGEKILDACAAPGGKSCHILELAPEVDLTALDLEEQRLKKVRENLERLHLKAKTYATDAIIWANSYKGEKFNAILLDAPCSGSGILRRHPDIAFLRTNEDLLKLPKTQMQLLTALWEILAEGGRLLYTTCSILPRENQLLIEQFLMLNPNAELKEITKIPDCINTKFGTLRLPDNNGDGFFYALIYKGRS